MLGRESRLNVEMESRELMGEKKQDETVDCPGHGWSDSVGLGCLLRTSEIVSRQGGDECEQHGAVEKERAEESR